jgi:hypothetical protein
VSDRQPYAYGPFFGVAQRTLKPNNATASVQTGQFLESCSANFFSRRRASGEGMGRLAQYRHFTHWQLPLTLAAQMGSSEKTESKENRGCDNEQREDARAVILGR